MLTVSEGALSRARSCCGHASGAHVWRYDDPTKGGGASYCNTCHVVCGKKASATRSPFADVIDDLRAGPVTRARGAVSPSGPSEFAKLTDELARASEDLGRARTAPTASVPEGDYLTMLEDDGRGRIRSVRVKIDPPSALERLADELNAAARPAPTVKTGAEYRAEAAARKADRERRGNRRLGQQYRELQRIARERQAEFDDVVAELEAAVR